MDTIRPTLSVIILCHNEAHHLRELLPSLALADRVVVIDDDSTDDTTLVCKQFGVEVAHRSLQNDFSAQRNFGLSLVKEGWVLFLDADERISERLMVEIREIARSLDRKSVIAYQIKRTDIFMGKRLRYGEVKDVWITRLAPVGAGAWTGKVHEVWQTPEVKKLEGELLHYSHESVSQLFGSVTGYAQIRARELFDKKRYWSAWEHATYPLAKFLYTYLVKLGFLDGFPGLMMSVAMSWHSFLVRWYLWELPWKKRTIGHIVERYLLVLPLLLLPLGQLNRGSVYVFEVVMGIAVMWVVGWRLISRHSWHWLPHSLPLLLFSLILGLSYFLSPFLGSGYLPGLYWLRWLLYVGYLLCLWVSSESKTLLISLSGLMRYVGYGLLAGGIVQFTVMPDMRWLYWFGWDDHYYRMVGTLLDPNFFGLMALLVGWWAFVNERGIVQKVSVTLAAICVVATYSRTSYLLGGLLIMYLLIKQSKKKVTLGLIALLVALFVVLPKPGGEGVNLLRTFSITTRIENAKQALLLAQEYPLLGIGYNYYPVVNKAVGAFGAPYHPGSPDSSWLFVLVTSGLVGFGAFVWLLVRWWVSMPTPFVRMSLLLILTHSFANNSFFYPWVLLWLWLIIVKNSR